MTCADGVVMAGDRRATMGNIIAQRDIEKVFIADSHSAIGIAGTAGVAVEMVRLFRLELEHYEKIEGVRLSLDGKANRLATMIRGNLGMAMQGLAVVPLFAGLRPAPRTRGRPGRIFSYDVAGGRYEETRLLRRRLGLDVRPRALKKRYEPGADLADGASARRSRRSTTRPTTTAPPVARTSPAGSSRWSCRSPPRAPSG